MSDLTVEKIDQLTNNHTGNTVRCLAYINQLETENKQLKQRIKELEEKLQFEDLMDDDLK